MFKKLAEIFQSLFQPRIKSKFEIGNSSYDSKKQDFEALKSDWETIGIDIHQVMDLKVKGSK